MYIQRFEICENCDCKCQPTCSVLSAGCFLQPLTAAIPPHDYLLHVEKVYPFISILCHPRSVILHKHN